VMDFHEIQAIVGVVMRAAVVAFVLLRKVK
jgi:hypothetical protein